MKSSSHKVYGVYVDGACFYTVSGDGNKWYARPTKLARDTYEEDCGKKPSFRMVETEVEAVATALRLGGKYKFHMSTECLDLASVVLGEAPAVEGGNRVGRKSNESVFALALATNLLERTEAPVDPVVFTLTKEAEEAPKPKKGKKAK